VFRSGVHLQVVFDEPDDALQVVTGAPERRDEQVITGRAETEGLRNPAYKNTIIIKILLLSVYSLQDFIYEE